MAEIQGKSSFGSNEREIRVSDEGEWTVLSLLRREFPPFACDLSFGLVLAVVVCCFNKSVIIINIFLNPFLLEELS